MCGQVLARIGDYTTALSCSHILRQNTLPPGEFHWHRALGAQDHIIGKEQLQSEQLTP